MLDDAQHEPRLVLRRRRQVGEERVDEAADLVAAVVRQSEDAHRRTRDDRELLAREKLERPRDRRVACAARWQERAERQQQHAAEPRPQQLAAREIEL